jgi:5-methylcytosine-specific restriction endonuclease McrA
MESEQRILDCDSVPSFTKTSVGKYYIETVGDARVCGTMSNLEVHHKAFRSRFGDDCEQNLITLCSACHATTHHG